MNKIKTEITWAFIFMLMTLVWMVLERVAGLHDAHIDKHPIFTNIIAIPAIAVYVLALREKKKTFYNGVMTYRQGLSSGLTMTLFITLLSPLTQYITSAYITPDYFKNVIEYSVSHNYLTREAAEATFNMKSYIIQTIIGTPVMGLITTALVALFIRTKNTNS